jgi:hypothetical protein
VRHIIRCVLAVDVIDQGFQGRTLIHPRLNKHVEPVHNVRRGFSPRELIRRFLQDSAWDASDDSEQFHQQVG